MKTPLFAFALSLVLPIMASVPLAAAVVISGTYDGTVTQLPGSTTDYDLFASTPQTTDFTVTQASDSYAENFFGGSIEAPGSSTAVGSESYFASDSRVGDTHFPSDLFSFTLANPKPSGSSLNYADFNVYVLFGASGFGFTSTAFTLAVGDTSNSTTANQYTVSDFTEINNGSEGGQIVEFNITGASAGDTFTLGATNGDSYSDVEAVSFATAAVPEPSSTALIGLGLGACFLIYARRRHSV